MVLTLELRPLDPDIRQQVEPSHGRRRFPADREGPDGEAPGVALEEAPRGELRRRRGGACLTAERHPRTRLAPPGDPGGASRW